MFNKNTFFLLGIFLVLALLSTSNARQEKPKVWKNIPITKYEVNTPEIAGSKVNDMHIGKKFNYYQTDQRIFMMKNDSIANLYEISIPDIIFAQQACSKVAFHSSELYSVSACRDLSDNTTYLVMVSHLSSRPFYFYSLKTDLKAHVSLSFVGDFLTVQDKDEANGAFTKSHLFRVNLGSAVGSSQPMEHIASSKIDISYAKAALIKIENTTFREWFFLFLAILGSLALLARCTTKQGVENQVRPVDQAERSESGNTDSYRLLEGNKNSSLSSAAPEAQA